MPGPFGWGAAVRRETERERARASKQRVLQAYSQPGCIFCREELQHLETYFFWYLNELFFEPNVIERMERSHGFCRRHTGHMLARSGPSTISRIYLWLLRPFLAALGSAEAAGLTQNSHPSLVATLRPALRCGACETETRALQPLLIDLKQTLDDPEVRERLLEGPAICLGHLLAVAPFLEWDQLSALVEAMLGWLERPSSQQSGLDLWERVELIRGLDVDSCLRARDAGAKPRERPNVETNALPIESDSWSPTLSDLHRLLAEPGCPICHERHRGLLSYLDWLSREITTAPPSQWSDALWLCRTHFWDFLVVADPVAADKLVAAIIGHWVQRLSELAMALGRRSQEGWWRRLATVPAELRQAAADGEEHLRPGSLLTRLGTAVSNAVFGSDLRLADLRARALRQNECPACRHLAAIASRTADLFARSLGDPATQDRYERSSGVCCRDLSLVLNFCRDMDRVRLLVRAAKVRLELLEWELGQAIRREAWDLRHEPRGGEQSAWRRAVEQVTGSHLGGPILIGLD